MITSVKRLLLYSLFTAELMVFSWTYFCGTQGLRDVWQLQRENRAQEQRISTKKLEIAHLQQELHQWDKDPFYKEKVAREQLQMARHDETIYYL